MLSRQDEKRRLVKPGDGKKNNSQEKATRCPLTGFSAPKAQDRRLDGHGDEAAAYPRRDKAAIQALSRGSPKRQEGSLSCLTSWSFQVQRAAREIRVNDRQFCPLRTVAWAN